MIGPLAALFRCLPRLRPRVRHHIAGAGTMVARPRPRLLRRAIALGCPAAALPTAAIPPVVPVVPLAAPPLPPAPLPFGIGTGPLLPPLAYHGSGFGETQPLLPLIGDTLAAASVPEPTTLSLLLVGLFVAAVVRLT